MNGLINNLNIIDLIYINHILHKYILNFVSHMLLLNVHRTFRKTGKKINITKFQKVELIFLVIQLFIYIGYYKILTIVPCAVQ